MGAAAPDWQVQGETDTVNVDTTSSKASNSSRLCHRSWLDLLRAKVRTRAYVASAGQSSHKSCIRLNVHTRPLLPEPPLAGSQSDMGVVGARYYIVKNAVGLAVR